MESVLRGGVAAPRVWEADAARVGMDAGQGRRVQLLWPERRPAMLLRSLRVVVKALLAHGI